MMNKNLDRIEAQLRQIFEKNLLTLFTNQALTGALIDDLINIMEQHLKENGEQIFAPDLFCLEVASEAYPEWETHQDILDEIAVKLYELGLKDGFFFQAAPKITLSVNPNLPSHSQKITAAFTPIQPSIQDTNVMPATTPLKNGAELPEDAHLILRGSENFPLEKAVINIGRHSDNDLTLDDKFVSRHHAQLRAINKTYVVFDLGSTGGILLNGKSIKQATLQAGDVLRIGSINLIYIQDSDTVNPTSAIDIEPDNTNWDGDHTA